MLDLRKDGPRLIKTVLTYSARVYHPSQELSARDRQLLAEAVLSRAYLLLDLVRSPRCAIGYWRAVLSLKTLDAKLYAETVKACRQLALRMVQDYYYGAFADYVSQFKPGMDGIHYKWMVTPLAELEKDGKTEMAILTAAFQWVSYDTKLNLRDLDFSTELSVEYLEDEYAMTRFSYDDDLIGSLNGIIREWCSGMKTVPETASWHFRHGNGATTELPRSKASPAGKCREFYVSPDDERYFAWRGSVESASFSDFTFRPMKREESPIFVDFVPKSPLTNRVISPEHVTKMWLQNDLAWLMQRMFDESHLNIHLHDQGRSRRLALAGSADGRYDTFDFSKASDFVTLELVSRVTDGTWLHDPLLWSRSKSATVGKPSRTKAGLARPVTVTLHKFAPMGSSTCFVVESLIFAAVCELAVRRTLGHRSRKDDYLVYGDDCVIRSDCSDEFRFLSSFLHFRVNDEKTCRYRNSHCYREACGIEALDGKDITPLRLSRRLVGCTYVSTDNASTPGEAIGVCDLINRCYFYGFTNLRKYFCALLRPWKRYARILRIDESSFSSLEKLWGRGVEPYIGLSLPYFVVDSSTATNYRCRTRFNSSLQRREVEVWTVRTESRKEAFPDYSEIAYFLWLLQAQKWDGEERYEDSLLDFVERKSATGAGPLKWAKRWIQF